LGSVARSPRLSVSRWFKFGSAANRSCGSTAGWPTMTSVLALTPQAIIREMIA
jgi:hypothetical protein